MYSVESLTSFAGHSDISLTLQIVLCTNFNLFAHNYSRLLPAWWFRLPGPSQLGLTYDPVFSNNIICCLILLFPLSVPIAWLVVYRTDPFLFPCFAISFHVIDSNGYSTATLTRCTNLTLFLLIKVTSGVSVRTQLSRLDLRRAKSRPKILKGKKERIQKAFIQDGPTKSYAVQQDQIFHWKTTMLNVR